MPARWTNSFGAPCGHVLHHLIPLVQAAINATVRLIIILTVLFNDSVIGLVLTAINADSDFQVLGRPSLGADFYNGIILSVRVSADDKLNLVIL